MHSAWRNRSLQGAGLGFLWGHRPVVNHTDGAADTRPHSHFQISTPVRLICLTGSQSANCLVEGDHQLLCCSGGSGESCSTNKPLLNLCCSTMWCALVCFEMCSRLSGQRYSLCQCAALHNWLKTVGAGIEGFIPQSFETAHLDILCWLVDSV